MGTTASNTIRVRADTGSLANVRSFCRSALESCCGKRQSFRLTLAIDEAMANVIEHAYSQSAGHTSTIDLSLALEKDRVVVKIVDRGVPFNPTVAEEAPPAAPPEEAKGDDGSLPAAELYPGLRRSTSHFPRHGFGLYLIRIIMDEVDYQRTPEGENLLILTKRLGRITEWPIATPGGTPRPAEGPRGDSSRPADGGGPGTIQER